MNQAQSKPHEVPFTEASQAAILGHAICDQSVFLQVKAMGVDPTWWSLSYHQLIWRSLVGFYDLHHSHPTEEELLEAVGTGHDRAMRKALQSNIEAARSQSMKIGIDSQMPQLTTWAKAKAIKDHVMEMAAQYNAHDIKAVVDTASKLVSDLNQIDRALGLGPQFSKDNVKYERKERLIDAKEENQLRYGVSYLDDALGGIIRKDLILVGARPGLGKTQLSTLIATENATRGKRVTYFALEAEHYEIERRIKFPLLVNAYQVDKNLTRLEPGKFNYADWRMGKLELELRPYEKVINRLFEERFPNLRTRYRLSGDFNVSTLNNSVTDAAMDSDLIIVDHIHYVDTDRDENADVKRAIKCLRDVALCYGIPIVVIAHLRKRQGNKSQAGLIADIDDFHGSSDLGKVATTAIAIAPAWDLIPDVAANNDGTEDPIKSSVPTYIRILKNRLEGSRTRYTGIVYFDMQTYQYDSRYSVGMLSANDTVWTPLEEKIPRWADPEKLVKILQPDGS